MSAYDLRPAVARCLALAIRHVAGGDPERARGVLGLALELASGEEVPVVIATADRLLTGAPPPPPRLAPVPEPALAAFDPTAVTESPSVVTAPPPPASAPAVTTAAAPSALAATAPQPSAVPRRKGEARRHMRPLLVATLLGAAVWGGVGFLQRRDPPDPAEARALLRRGQELLSRGDTASALPALREAARAADRSPNAPAATASRILDRVE